MTSLKVLQPRAKGLHKGQDSNETECYRETLISTFEQHLTTFLLDLASGH